MPVVWAEKEAAGGEPYRVLAILYCMAALDTQINETKDQLDEALHAGYLCFSKAALAMQLDNAPAFLRFSLHLASCPVADKALLIYFILPNRDIIFLT